MGSIGMSYSGVEEYGLLEGSLVFAEEFGSGVGAVAVVDGENTMLRGRDDVERVNDYSILGDGLMGGTEAEFSLGYPIAKGRERQESSTSSIRSFCSGTSTRESVFRGRSLYDTDVFSVTTGTPSLEEQGSQSIDSSVATTLVAGAVDPLMAYTACAEVRRQVPYGQNPSPPMAFPTTLRSQGDAAQTATVMEQIHSAPRLQRQAPDERKPAPEQLRKVPRQRRCSRRASGTIASVYNNNTNNPNNSQNNSNNSGNSPTSTSSKKVSDSRLSAQGLAEFLKLSSAEEALRRERFVLDILENELHYPLGYKTWVRDTSKKYRSQLLNLLHKRVRVKYPEYDKSVLETIIRRATYYMMQSRLRRERRAKAKCENSAKCNNAASQPIPTTCEKNGTAHLFGASVNALLCQSERNPNLKTGHQGKDGENWCV